MLPPESARVASGSLQMLPRGVCKCKLESLLPSAAAVLEKRVGFKLGQKDVFLNIAGGIKVNDPAMDLAIISAILSSNMDMSIEEGTCLTGEVGLSGEIRPVNRIEQRILEAEKLGFSRIIIPHNNISGFDTSKLKIQILQVRKVEEAFRLLFG